MRNRDIFQENTWLELELKEAIYGNCKDEF